MMAILIILLLLFMAAIGFIYVAFVHITLKKEYKQECKEKKWMDNSEFDYGHDVRYESREN